jgi:phage shock protein C
MRKRFTLDKANGKLMGVCAGIARMTGWDVTVVRVATVVATLIVHPLVIVYFIAGLVAAKSEPRERFDDDAPPPRARWATTTAGSPRSTAAWRAPNRRSPARSSGCAELQS